MAQALSPSSQPNSGMPIFRLPDEVLQLISFRLFNKDIKNLRLASKRLSATSTLRIERVFISPSYKNIEVLPEFIIDVNGEATGITYQFFETESTDFSNFETICGHGLKRLDLAVNVARYRRSPGLKSLPNSLLKSALSAATSLQHFSIHTSTATRDVYSNENFNDRTDVHNVIPGDEWKSLEPLTVSHLPLKASELLDLFKELPPTIQSLEFRALRKMTIFERLVGAYISTISVVDLAECQKGTSFPTVVGLAAEHYNGTCTCTCRS